MSVGIYLAPVTEVGK